MEPLLFALTERTDLAELQDAFQADGRVEIRDFMARGQSEMLRAHLIGREDWLTVMNAGEKVYEIPRAGFHAMSAAQRTGLDDRIGAAARHGFQYRYEAIRVADHPATREQAPSMLTAFVDFMSSAVVLGLLSTITGLDDLGFADGQATAYGAGDFLTRHDDDVAGKQRRAAYVFGLTPGWRAEWGGLLMFHRPDGNVAEGYAPAMGALRLFRVPVSHSVSYVVPFAPEPRVSVTGWLRAGSPDAQSSE